MFEQVFVTHHQAGMRPWAVLVSFAGELALIALAVFVPLLFTDAIPTGWLTRQVFLPAPPPGRPAPPPAEVIARRSGGTPRHFRLTGKLTEPVRFPPKPAVLLDPEEAAPAGTLAYGGFGVPGGTGAPEVAGGFGGLVPANPAPAPPPTREIPALPQEIPRVRVGGNVAPPVPLSTPQPDYPALARRARVEGLVRLEAVIAADGTVRSIRVLQGYPLLVEAAVRAVSRWLYQPPTLNGDPVEMVMIVDVNFKLGR